eukprot:15458660-Alexandrium_andersonii.AAC.2
MAPKLKRLAKAAKKVVVDPSTKQQQAKQQAKPNGKQGKPKDTAAVESPEVEIEEAKGEEEEKPKQGSQ